MHYDSSCNSSCKTPYSYWLLERDTLVHGTKQCWKYLALQELLDSGLQLGHGNMPYPTSGALIILHGTNPTLCTLGNAPVVLCWGVLLFVLYSLFFDSLLGASLHSSKSAVVASLPTSSHHQYQERMEDYLLPEAPGKVPS